jgi:hypothetical protein
VRSRSGFVSAGDYNAELTFGSTKMKQTFHIDLAEGITAVIAELDRLVPRHAVALAEAAQDNGK